MCSNCHITIYEHFSAIKGAKPYLTPRYDYMIVIYYPRNSRQFLLPFTACNSCCIIQQFINSRKKTNLLFRYKLRKLFVYFTNTRRLILKSKYYKFKRGNYLFISLTCGNRKKTNILI